MIQQHLAPVKYSSDAQYWLIPKDIFASLNAEFNFDFDPCPYPYKQDGIEVTWGNCNWINPPFRKKDAINNHGPTAFVRKAIDESKKGKTSVMVLPTQSYVNLMLEAGAELRSMGRIRWVDARSNKPCTSPSPITLFVLRGQSLNNRQESKGGK